jgi:hypothetical protein
MEKETLLNHGNVNPLVCEEILRTFFGNKTTHDVIEL